MRILIFEGDGALGMFLSSGLEAEGYSTIVVHEKPLILPTLVEHPCSLAIIDFDGFGGPQAPESALSLLHEIRLLAAGTSIIVLSSEVPVDVRVLILDSGTDDLITKPFSYYEFAARVRTMLRRGHAADTATLTLGELLLNRYQRTVSRAGALVDLTAREFRLLEFLMRNHGRNMSRHAILQHVWADGRTAREASAMADEGGEQPLPAAAASMTNIVDVYINYLRQKLGDSKERRLIHTVRGVGYRLGEPEAMPPEKEPSSDDRQLQAC